MSRRQGSRLFLVPVMLAALLVTAGPVGLRVQAQETSPAATANPSAGSSEAPASPAPSASATPDPLAGIELLVRGEPDPDLVVPDTDLAALVRGNTAFALDLYRQVAAGSDNLVVGPLSISLAMGMNRMGARGTTASETDTAMHFDLPPDRLAAAFDGLDRELEGLANPKVTISLVNQLFGQQGYAFKDPFLETLSTRFAAPMAVVDFGDPEAVRQLINRWVASQTADRIPDLIGEGLLTPLTRLVLVNATYLKADWAWPFNAAYTEDRPFRLASGASVRVPTMRQEGEYPIARDDGYRAIELPYEGDRLAMLIVVPDRLARFERTLNPDRLDAIVERLRSGRAILTLPTFSARSRVDLVEPLTALGIRDSWDPTRADLSGISDEPDLHVSAAVHQAFVKVAEQGTEAAAATAIGDSGTSGPPPAFKVDQPFLWFIRDRETGTILFLGRVADPLHTAE